MSHDVGLPEGLDDASAMSALERPVRTLIFCTEEYTDACCQLASDVIDAVRAKFSDGPEEGVGIVEIATTLSMAMEFKSVETDVHRRFLVLARYWDKHEVKDLVVTVALIRDMMRAYMTYHDCAPKVLGNLATIYTPSEETVSALDNKKDAVDNAITVFTNELEAIINVFHPDQSDD